MSGFIETYGKLAGYISAIIALLTLVLFKPIRGAVKRRKCRKADEARVIRDFQASVMGELRSIKDITQGTSNAVADLQCDRLNQAHDYWMAKGYCPTDTKAMLCKIYHNYHAEGHNHLSEQYEEDLINLPSKPPHRIEEELA